MAVLAQSDCDTNPDVNAIAPSKILIAPMLEPHCKGCETRVTSAHVLEIVCKSDALIFLPNESLKRKVLT